MPTVTVLAGPSGLALQAWGEWSAGENRQVAFPTGVTSLEIWTAWIDKAMTSARIAAVNWLANVLGKTESDVLEQIRSMTRYDYRQFWRTLPTDTSRPDAIAAKAVLHPQVEDKPFLIGEFENRSPEDSVKALSELIPEPQWPTLFLKRESPPADSNWLANVLRTIESFLVAVPKLAVGVVISEQEYRSFIESSTPSRYQTLAREGYVPVVGVTPTEIAEQFTQSGLPIPKEQSLQKLTEEGLSEDAATAYVDLAKSLAQPDVLDDQARSAAERFLFEKLNSHPPTAGLFRLNDKLGFLHGPKRAEADLVDERHKVVIEVDGAYFHLTPEQYRRDRMKDWKYQQHGFFVLRFLAEDVLSEWPRIIAMATEAVQVRSLCPPLQGKI